MKVAISTTGTDLDAPVDIRFGRCQYFVIMDSDTLEFEVIENPNIGLMSRAGIQSGQMMVDRGIQVVLTGNIGPNAFETLSGVGVQVIAGVKGTVREAIHKLNRNQLRPLSRATVPECFSVGSVCLGTEDDDEFA